MPELRVVGIQLKMMKPVMRVFSIPIVRVTGAVTVTMRVWIRVWIRVCRQ